MRALDPVTGTLRWNFSTFSPVASAPAIGSDGSVYFGGMDSCIYGIAPSASQTPSMTQSATQSATPSQIPSAGSATLYGSRAGDLYGSSVALSSDGLTLVVGAPGYAGSAGGVFVHTCANTGGGCNAATTIISGGGGNFGCAVTMTGDAGVVAVGAANLALGSGGVFVYSCVAGTAACATTATSSLSACCGFTGIHMGSALSFSVSPFVCSVAFSMIRSVG